MTHDLALISGWAERHLTVGEADIDLPTAGACPALVLLHGHPQTQVCWHKIAGELARRALVGAEVDSGHFLAMENPPATLAAILPFLAAHGGRQ